MNAHANGRGTRTAVPHFETIHHSETEWLNEWQTPAGKYFPNTYTASEYESEWEAREAEHYAHPSMASDAEWENQFSFQNNLKNIQFVARKTAPLARYLSPIAVRVLISAVPGARASFNPLTAQLLRPLLQKGERYSRQQEAEFFGTQATKVKVANKGKACEAALTEVLAAEASHTESESEAAALIGTTVPIAFRVMGDRKLIHSVLPVLLVATARLVRFLHRHSPASRRLLRLVPTILRQTIASLQLARRWGCPMSSALVGCVMAIQTQRVLGNSRTVSLSITRNALLRALTVAPARHR